MRRFIATRLVNEEICTIIGTADYKGNTYTEDWYFNGVLYQRETYFFKNNKDLDVNYDIQCDVHEKDNIIHLL